MYGKESNKSAMIKHSKGNMGSKEWDSKGNKGFAAMKRAQKACKTKGAGKY